MFASCLYDSSIQLHLFVVPDTQGRKLGSGSFGRVYVAEKKTTQEQFAMKIISLPVSDAEKLTFPDWKAELELAGHVESAFVVKIFECFETNDDVYLIMELCEKGTLFDEMLARKNRGESFTEAVWLFLLFFCLICDLGCHPFSLIGSPGIWI
jgi:serine/threonine protein kinase